MNTLLLILMVGGLAVFSHLFGSRLALRKAGPNPSILHSLPGYHGVYVALWCGVPALILIVLWLAFEPMIVHTLVLGSLPETLLHNPDGSPLDEARVRLMMSDIGNVAKGNISSSTDPEILAAARYQVGLENNAFWSLTVLSISLALAGAAWGLRSISPVLRARNQVEQIMRVFMILCSTVAIATTIGIVLSLLFESYRFFTLVPLHEFLFGISWSPQMALRPDQVGSSGAFGAVPLFAGTALIGGIALLVAVPIGLLSAIYMSEYANPKFRAFAKPALEILAGIPTVVYGFFAALTVAPAIRNAGEALGLDVSSESALAAGVVMGIMIIPFVSSLSDDVISAVPQSMREGSLGLGATKSETIRRVVFPAALPGIVGGILLAASRAIGETMIVVMAAGLAANLTANPFEAVTTVTVQIVTLLIGDQEFDSPKTLAAFALGLVLFCITLVLNIVALHVVRKYREQYD
ncbi:phosphate ABC transporter permease subunit PstC [Pararhodospirillum oryzae]|uniref:Phosphate transport system permease protein n=1 Tax=Pararhodospirillum oryzae TaxID=478448 RepID=A0A512HBD4_9PROT|nr:phosphate ABC transporter permease subunit PstC [Pararhodospirillum oryzae]GEO82761.1 phosphate transport system permease protein [Pararhodospirillum oryzae]